ncbi:hypothetical protein S40285_10137 [Stachybotrys chlorohalonatus IBT 40285]|uniref:Uncharacterized protein n=1 Tax=Stachybotrys chlorohalonatus (strain IBT 40285) TaxID=1283841 RepID=A0A084QQ32_STAC4|nr:hypothetical protein S40285_10137 [Stachybotrys chlorohalonata IBT 40285]
MASKTRAFKVYKPSLGFRRRYEISSSSGGPPIISVDISEFTPGKPDLTFHRGADLQAPVLGVCHFSSFGGNMRVGLGDPVGDASGVQWEELAKDTLWGNKYTFSTALAAPPGGGARQTFRWTRTSLMTRDFALTDDAGATVAVFESDAGLASGGTLRLEVDYGMGFDYMVIMTFMAIFDKIRRRRAASGGG